jgi:hypothetical protein
MIKPADLTQLLQIPLASRNLSPATQLTVAACLAIGAIAAYRFSDDTAPGDETSGSGFEWDSETTLRLMGQALGLAIAILGSRHPAVRRRWIPLALAAKAAVEATQSRRGSKRLGPAALAATSSLLTSIPEARRAAQKIIVGSTERMRRMRTALQS